MVISNDLFERLQVDSRSQLQDSLVNHRNRISSQWISIEDYLSIFPNCSGVKNEVSGAAN